MLRHRDNRSGLTPTAGWVVICVVMREDKTERGTEHVSTVVRSYGTLAHRHRDRTTFLNKGGRKTVDAKIDRPSVGQWETVIVTNVFKNGYEGPPAGSPGDYEVTFVFGQPIFHIAEMNISFDTEGGDSYIQMHPPGTPPDQQLTILTTGQLPNNGQVLSAKITANGQGRIAKATYEKVPGQNRHEAESVAYRLLKPMLAWASLAYDIPIDINKIVTKELRNGNTSITAWMSPPVIGVDTRFTPPPLEAHLAECVNQYNEGNNSINDFYRFLCFWKVFLEFRRYKNPIAESQAPKGFPRVLSVR